MDKFVILADSTCDLPESFQTQYDIRILPGHIVLPDKRDIPAFLKWELFTRDEFYAQLKSNPTGFATAPPNVAEYTQAFEAIVQEGLPVLCLTISSGISGAYNFALAAKKDVLSRFPQARIEVFDSLRFGPAIGLMAVHASALRAEGQDIDAVFSYLEENRNRFHQAGWLDDLSFVARKGRLTHAKAFFGTLAGVKPLGEFDYNGLTTVIAKVKGSKTAYSVLMTYIEKTIVNPEEQIIFIAQSNRLEQAKAYKTMIEERFHPKAVYIHDVFPACGVNIGPGLMAAYYMGKPISNDLSEERAIMDAAISGEVK